MKNIFMVMHGLKFTNGGITSVMLNRSHFFAELGYHVNLVTFDDEEDYKALEELFKKTGRLSEQAFIINFFNYYKEKNTDNKSRFAINKKREILFNKTNTNGYLIQSEYYESKKFVRYFTAKGELIKCKYWSKNGENLNRIDYYNKSILQYSKKYKNNALNKIISYNDQGEDVEVRFFTEDGFCYFQRSFLGDSKLLHLFLFDRKTGEVKGFNSYQKLHTFFLEELCESQKSGDNIIICDGPGSTEKVALVNSSKAKKILTIHSNHLTAPYTVGAPVKKGVMPVFTYINQVDAVVVLTDSQKKDIVKEFGHSDKYHVIQNTVDILDNKLIEKKWDDGIKVINIVSRYVVMKRLQDVVLAVSLLLEKRLISKSDIRVNFFGSGKDKSELISYISSLNLGDVVSVNDYITNVDAVFREADITLMTSTYEGFGLTIIEAMSNKTPVISYDINYGPRDIITDGVDGFLVKSGDIKELSEKIYEVLFRNYSSLPDISENAYSKVKDKFSHPVAAKLWKQLLEEK